MTLQEDCQQRDSFFSMFFSQITRHWKICNDLKYEIKNETPESDTWTNVQRKAQFIYGHSSVQDNEVYLIYDVRQSLDTSSEQLPETADA